MTMGGSFATSPDIFSVNSNTFLRKELRLVEINHKFSNFESLEFWKILNVIRFWYGRMYIKISYRFYPTYRNGVYFIVILGLINKMDVSAWSFLKFITWDSAISTIVLHIFRLQPLAHDPKTTYGMCAGIAYVSMFMPCTRHSENFV